jgi:hypothetical protein
MILNYITNMNHEKKYSIANTSNKSTVEQNISLNRGTEKKYLMKGIRLTPLYIYTYIKPLFLEMLM